MRYKSSSWTISIMKINYPNCSIAIGLAKENVELPVPSRPFRSLTCPLPYPSFTLPHKFGKILEGSKKTGIWQKTPLFWYFWVSPNRLLYQCWNEYFFSTESNIEYYSFFQNWLNRILNIIQIIKIYSNNIQIFKNILIFELDEWLIT